MSAPVLPQHRLFDAIPEPDPPNRWHMPPEPPPDREDPALAAREEETP